MSTAIPVPETPLPRPGSSTAREMARLRALARHCVPDTLFQALIGQLVGLGLRGHYPALKLALEYLCGRPEPAVPADEVPLHEMNLAVRQRDKERLCRGAGIATDTTRPAVSLADEAGQLPPAINWEAILAALSQGPGPEEMGDPSRPDAHRKPPKGSKRRAKAGRPGPSG